VLSDAVERRQLSATVAREINKLPDELAEPLRQRVQAGARLQHKDIEEVRAQMAREGRVHPRLARPAHLAEAGAGGERAAPSAAEAAGARPTGDLPEGPEAGAALPPPPELVPPRWLEEGPHRVVRSDKEAFEQIQQEYQRLRASGLPSAPPPPAAAGAAEPGLEQPAPGRSPTGAPAGASESLAALLDELDLRRLRPVLLYGIERGMSCAGLWQHILELRRPERPG
jgi:hypothetical protein